MSHEYAKAADRPVRLGKREVKHDPKNLMFASFLTEAAALPAPAKSVRRTHEVAAWPMYGNDHLADCTCAAVGHIDQLVSAVTGKPETPSLRDVLDLYWSTGDPPGENQDDNGRYCLDILNRWRKVGFGSGGIEEKLVAFVQIDPKNRVHMKLAMDIFGGVYAGLGLPVSAQTQKTWRVVRGPNAEPGSWGGHCIAEFDYDSRYVTCVSWGKPLKMTWGFVARYTDEAYAVISPDWLDAQGQSPDHRFNVQELLDTLKQL